MLSKPFYCFSSTRLISSIKHEHSSEILYLSYDIKITLKSHFFAKKCLFCHYVRNVVMNVIAFPENL